MPAKGAKAKAKALAEPSTLMEKLEASEPQHATCKGQKPKRDIEGHVDKLIKDNFQGWGAAAGGLCFTGRIDFTSGTIAWQSSQPEGRNQDGQTLLCIHANPLRGQPGTIKATAGHEPG